MLRKSSTTFLLSASVLTLSVGWLSVASNAQVHQAGAVVSGEQGRFKGIFEPVNYSQDINFTDVFFTSVDEGWVSGEHATILHTSDGGKTWTTQVGGDPSGPEKPIGKLRFLDSKHGWAVTGEDPERLLRTMDGENWQQIGEAPVGAHSFVDYAFTSVRHGILLGGNNSGFYFTNDGGRHWQNVPCVVRATLQGLARTEGCYVAKLQMLSAQSGYALVRWSGGIAFLRTDDGGEHWTSIVNDVSECCGPEFFFTNLNHGVMVFNNGKTYITDDGAKTWHALLSGSVGVGGGQGEMPIHFTDPQVGWVIGESRDNSRTFRVCYSIDGGLHWKTPQNNIAFPVHADHLKFNFTRRDRAYVIGDHGMIYRYRVVQANSTAANAFPGPLMPEFDTTQVTAAANRVHQDIIRLQQEIAAASGGTIPLPAGTPPSAGGATASPSMSVANSVSGFMQSTVMPTSPGQPAQSTPDASSGGTFVQDAATNATSVPQGQPGASAASATGGFMQDTAAAAAFSSDPTNANLTQGFTQSVDTSTPSAPLQSCCGPTLQSLQTSLTGFNQAAATHSTQFRSLNLIIAGIQFVTNLLNQAQQLRNSFTALKRAPTLQAASGALQKLAATMNSTQQSVSTGFQNQGGWFAANAPASFVQDVGTDAAGAGSATPAGTFSAGASGGAGFTSGTVAPAVSNPSNPQQGVAFAAVVQGAASTPLTMATAQVVAANAKAQDLNTLAADNAVLQSLQQGATGAVQQTASRMSSLAANSLSIAAGGLVGGLFKKGNPTVVYLWGLPNSGGTADAVSNQPSFQINYASIPGVDTSDYAPALVRMVPAQNGWFLVGAAKGQTGALQSSSVDWDVYSSFMEQRLPAQVSQTATGQATVRPAQPLAPGAYAIVLRPAARNKKFSGADLAGLQGDGLAFDAVWRFKVSANAAP